MYRTAESLVIEEPGRTGSRFVSLCASVFIGAMALYGAVLIIQEIWVWLCGMAAVAGVAWLLWARFRRW